MSTPITADMPLSVQNPVVKWVFEPTVMSRSGVVCASTSDVVECMQLPAGLQVKGHAAPSNHLTSSYVLYAYLFF